MKTDSPTTTKKNAAAQALGRLGGTAGTAAQNAARAKNGKKGGRPGRVCSTCGGAVKGGHADTALDATCGQHGWRWQNGDEPERDLLRDVLRAFQESEEDVAGLVARIRRALRSR